MSLNLKRANTQTQSSIFSGTPEVSCGSGKSFSFSVDDVYPDLGSPYTTVAVEIGEKNKARILFDFCVFIEGTISVRK